MLILVLDPFSEGAPLTYDRTISINFSKSAQKLESGGQLFLLMYTVEILTQRSLSSGRIFTLTFAFF